MSRSTLSTTAGGTRTRRSRRTSTRFVVEVADRPRRRGGAQSVSPSRGPGGSTWQRLARVVAVAGPGTSVPGGRLGPHVRVGCDPVPVDVSSVTVGLPVSDLDRAIGWYQRTFALDGPDLEPADGVVEFQLGPLWLQLGQESTARSGAEVVVRLGVPDATSQHARLVALGIAPGPLQHVEGAVDYFAFSDPDGNRLSIYSLAAGHADTR